MIGKLLQPTVTDVHWRGNSAGKIAMLDMPHKWDRPITIRIHQEEQIVLTPAQARNVLLMEWPAERSDKHKIASETCLAAMEGAAPEAAWVAFMDAAIEAGIFVE